MKKTSRKDKIPIPSIQEIEDIQVDQSPASWLTINSLITFVKVLIYIFGQILAIKLEFGAVFFVFSIFYVICSSLGDRKKRRSGELSAYSVFNPNFEEIDGTTSGDQLTKQMTMGF